MKNCHELYEILDYWNAYQPNSWSGSMLKAGKIREVKAKILSNLDPIRDRKAILSITGSK
ncbi:hypothetical protein PHPI107946_03090 [Phocicoccus pinnipedialis]|uniref:Uncharacterized protein n=1 Tax=Phocicoccus pinnipedialis TaxID=110845 RepID=A0A6V7R4R7_9BACL|nr:hypothetical protein [Jeotgalicoccus pinnipedialis]MBP1939758.1 hypothetical protein [Jeotgalicoccus pinnipedialis]CAD2072380.1 hypothetical protein JEOPIN946_00480 [Jeotgalicoccus pinnipedialis]